MTSVRQQLTRTLLGTVLALGGAGATVMFFAARDAATDQFDAALRAKALAIIALTVPNHEGFAVALNDHFLRSFDGRTARDFFEIWDPTGRVLARSPSLGQADLRRPARLRLRPSFWSQRLPTSRPGRAIGVFFDPGPVSIPAGTAPDLLVVASDCSGLNEDLWQLIAIASASGAVLLGATFWLIPRALHAGLQPLERLGERAAAIDAQSLGTRFSLHELPAELRPIAHRLNDLLSRIEESFDRERRFSADLAHELRTPLAELRSMVECSQRWPETRRPEEPADILAISEQMEGIVSHLLALARGEQGLIPANQTTIPLDSVVRDRWQRLADRAAERGLSADLLLEPVKAEADPILLRSILDNVLENAVEYSAVPAVLQISVQANSGRAEIRVQNPAPTLAEADVPRLFERFWRKEESRTGGRHVGLGLPLARSFAESIGWRLAAELGPAGILTVTLSQPHIAGTRLSRPPRALADLGPS